MVTGACGGASRQDFESPLRAPSTRDAMARLSGLVMAGIDLQEYECYRNHPMYRVSIAEAGKRRAWAGTFSLLTVNRGSRENPVRLARAGH